MFFIQIKKSLIKVTFLCSDFGRVRTCNQRSRNPPFYPVELRSHNFIAMGNNNANIASYQLHIAYF
jgi:hypothetical protein